MLFLFFMFFVLFNVVFLLLLKHKRTKLQTVRVRHTPFPGQSECFVAAVLTSFDSY